MNDDTTASDRLKHALNYLRINQTDLSKTLDFSQSYISQIISGHRSPSHRFLKIFTTAYPEISINWIEYGEGLMLLPGDQPGIVTANEPLLEYAGRPVRTASGGVLEEILLRMEQLEARMAFLIAQNDDLKMMLKTLIESRE